DDSEAVGGADAARTGRRVAHGRRRPVALALRLRTRQLHRDPDGRSAAVRRTAAARADTRRRIARSGRALSRARRRMATMKTDEKSARLKRREYEKALGRLQEKLCGLQDWVKAKGLRVIVLFEGRDAAGKGGTI